MVQYSRETFLTVGRRHIGEKIEDEKFKNKMLSIKRAVEADYIKFLKEKSEKTKIWKMARGGAASGGGKRYGKGRYNKRRNHHSSSRYEPKMAPILVNWRSYKASKGQHEVDFSKTLNSLLNKISGDNFDKIQAKIFDMLGETKDLYCTLEQLFNKAISQRSYCKYYAHLAANLNEIKDYNKIVKPAIVEYCQNLYKENSILSSEAETKSYDELCSYFEYKKRFTGNFQFIGELYKYKLLDITMIEDFWNILLKDIRNGGEYIESNSECACRLLSTIGKKLEQEYKINTEFDSKYLKPVREFSKDKESFSPRIRFLFMDCAERRRWI